MRRALGRGRRLPHPIDAAVDRERSRHRDPAAADTAGPSRHCPTRKAGGPWRCGHSQGGSPHRPLPVRARRYRPPWPRGPAEPLRNIVSVWMPIGHLVRYSAHRRRWVRPTARRRRRRSVPVGKGQPLTVEDLAGLFAAVPRFGGPREDPQVVRFQREFGDNLRPPFPGFGPQVLRWLRRCGHGSP